MYLLHVWLWVEVDATDRAFATTADQFARGILGAEGARRRVEPANLIECLIGIESDHMLRVHIFTRLHTPHGGVDDTHL